MGQGLPRLGSSALRGVSRDPRLILLTLVLCLHLEVPGLELLGKFLESAILLKGPLGFDVGVEDNG